MPWLLAQTVPEGGQPAGPAGGGETAPPATTTQTGEAAQPGTPPPPPQSICGDPYLPFLLLGVWAIFYLLVFRPQRKQEKEKQARLESLKKGDVVRTRGGVVASVLRVKDDTVILELEGDARVEMVVAKAYVDEVYGKDGDAKKAPAK
jgi:preprotein translocase subunit YajC